VADKALALPVPDWSPSKIVGQDFILQAGL
jgi:hypothetical protein